MPKKYPILIKCAGGATAQLLALSNAIYLSKKLNRPFKIKYYPTSTGTFWEFAIGNLLNPDEISEEGLIRGVSTSEILKSGEYITEFHTKRKGFSYATILNIIHKLQVDSLLRRFRGEIVVGGKRRKLDNVKGKTKTVTGNFVPLMDTEGLLELSQRFENAKLPNPFSAPVLVNEVVIHYRLGDMRKMPDRISNLGGHGIVNPTTFKKILESENVNILGSSIICVSDEPLIAEKLLAEVGIKSKSDRSEVSLWFDLKTIASAKLFIGSMSQFSMFGAMLCANNGGRPYLPSSVYGKGNSENDLEIDLFNYFNYEYLPSGHRIFSER
jgi:hypothetical protein